MPTAYFVTISEWPAVSGSLASMVEAITWRSERNCLSFSANSLAFLMLMPMVGVMPIRRFMSLCRSGLFVLMLSTASMPSGSSSYTMGQQMNDLVPSLLASSRLLGERVSLMSSMSFIRKGLLSL